MIATIPSTDDKLAAILPVVAPHDEAPEAPGAPVNLPEEFWAARPMLGQIRQYAWSRYISGDALLGVVLARISAATPHTYMLPPIVGSSASLNTYVGLIGGSGTGKSTSNRAGADLVPLDDPAIVDMFPVGSGEGLPEAYFEVVPEVDEHGHEVKGKTRKRQTKRSVLAYADEGQGMMEQGGRNGATLLMNLRQMWTGEVAGQGNASTETKRILAGRTYRFSLIAGFQPEYAMPLLDDAAGGTPQRFIFMSTTDPNIPVGGTVDPGPIDWKPLPLTASAGTDIITHLGIDSAITAEVQAARVDIARGVQKLAELDSHRTLNRLKVAALLATLERRHHVELRDWHLAEIVMATSDAVRDQILAHAVALAAVAEAKSTARKLRVRAAEAHDDEARKLDRAANNVADKVMRSHLDGAGATTRRVIQASGSKVTREVGIDVAIAEAEARGLITREGDGWVPGSPS